MSRRELIEQAAIFREHTKGMTLAFLPLLCTLVLYTIYQLVYFVISILKIKEDSGLVLERLHQLFSTSMVMTIFMSLIYFLLIGVVSFYLLQLIRGDRARLYFKDSFSLFMSEWNKPILQTLLSHYCLHFVTGLPILFGFTHFMQGLIMSSLMILSPGAMAELAQYEPKNMIDLGLSVFLFGCLFYLTVYYTYSQTIYILFDQLDNATFSSAIHVLRESRLLMLGNYYQRIRLDLGFIAWFIGCWLSLNILAIYVLPYYQNCKALFYEEIKNERLLASE